MRWKGIIPVFVTILLLCNQLSGQVLKSERSSIRLTTRSADNNKEESVPDETKEEPVRIKEISTQDEDAANEVETKEEEIPDALPPEIKLVSPLVVDDSYTSKFAEVGLIGQAIDASGIQLIFVNAERVQYSGDGIFNLKLSLDPGVNTVHIVAFDTHSNFSEKWFTINYEPEKLTLAEKLSKKSNYYALIIGINHYQDYRLIDLDNPIKDAERLKNVLTSRYIFRDENVSLIKDAKREDIIMALDDLSRKVTPEDNLVIFYAGHGWWDQQANIGYWLPSDAKKDNKAAWFRNSTLVDYLKEIECKHTLLITDACFAGAIFKTRAAFDDAPRAIEKLYELPSRKAMTSGTLTEVPDQSAFVDFLIDRLKHNPEKYLSAEQLFSGFRIAVINNSNAVPQFGEISGVGDEGGDFIFILK